MTAGFQIRPVRDQADLIATAALFEGYAASLPIDLGYQDFAGELAALPGKYAPPSGELLLARNAAGTPVGCVAMRAIAPDGCCEMKRLFLLPEARRTGLGKALAQAVIDAARARGYREMRLDSLPSMMAARQLYEQMGFVSIEAYYAPTPPGTVFMSLTL